MSVTLLEKTALSRGFISESETRPQQQQQQLELHIFLITHIYNFTAIYSHFLATAIIHSLSPSWGLLLKSNHDRVQAISSSKGFDWTITAG